VAVGVLLFVGWLLLCVYSAELLCFVAFCGFFSTDVGCVSIFCRLHFAWARKIKCF